MHYRNVLLAATAIALPGAAALTAQTAGMKAHADIKGDGITGTLTLTERKQGTGTVVEFTLTVQRPEAGQTRRAPARGRQMRAGLHCRGRPLRSRSGRQHGSRCQSSVPHGRYPEPGGRRRWLRQAEGVTTRVTLSPGPLSLFDADGTRGDHSWQRGPGHDRRAEVGRERRPEGRLRRDHQAVAPASASHSFSSPGAPPGATRRSLRSRLVTCDSLLSERFCLLPPASYLLPP